MAYTYKTEQFGRSGAIGSIFKDGVFVWSTDMVQAFGHYDTDRKRAARIVRKRIAKLKQFDIPIPLIFSLDFPHGKTRSDSGCRLPAPRNSARKSA